MLQVAAGSGQAWVAAGRDDPGTVLAAVVPPVQRDCGTRPRLPGDRRRGGDRVRDDFRARNARGDGRVAVVAEPCAEVFEVDAAAATGLRSDVPAVVAWPALVEVVDPDAGVREVPNTEPSQLLVGVDVPTVRQENFGCTCGRR